MRFLGKIVFPKNYEIKKHAFSSVSNVVQLRAEHSLKGVECFQIFTGFKPVKEISGKIT